MDKLDYARNLVGSNYRPSNPSAFFHDFRSLPKSCPYVGASPLKYSVGYYRGKKRHVIAWFAERSAACDYILRTRQAYPHLLVDLLESLL